MRNCVHREPLGSGTYWQLLWKTSHPPPFHNKTFKKPYIKTGCGHLSSKSRIQCHDGPLGSQSSLARQPWDKEFKTEAKPCWSSCPNQHKVRVMSKNNTKGVTAQPVDTLSVAGMQEKNHGAPFHCTQTEHYWPLLTEARIDH